MTSINQNDSYPISLPNFCNLGVMLRILVIVNAMAFAAAMIKAPDFAAVWRELLEIALIVQPILLLSLLLLCLFNKPLRGLSYRQGVVALLALELAITAGVYKFFLQPFFIGGEIGTLLRYALLCLMVSGVLLSYFYMRSRILSPAIGEARLQALQARIRPHFLFNSINAVLSLMRAEPQRAEQALENMADLFRVLMADNRQLTRLENEVKLSRQYLELEQLRLGERLQVAWHIEKMPGDALIPPLVLQPLLENAVYHGIEPSIQPGEININIYRNRDQVHLVLRNPYQRDGDHHSGNKMALANIRERLALHFDVEARLDTQVSDTSYQVHIIVPYMSEK